MLPVKKQHSASLFSLILGLLHGEQDVEETVPENKLVYYKQTMLVPEK